MKNSKYFYSNCLLEAIKAKIKNSKIKMRNAYFKSFQYEGFEN